MDCKGVSIHTLTLTGRKPTTSFRDRQPSRLAMRKKCWVRGSVAFIPRGVSHAYRNVGGEALKLAVISSYDV